MTEKPPYSEARSKFRNRRWTAIFMMSATAAGVALVIFYFFTNSEMTTPDRVLSYLLLGFCVAVFVGFTIDYSRAKDSYDLETNEK